MSKATFIVFVVLVLLIGGGIFAYLFGYTDVFISRAPQPTKQNEPAPATGKTSSPGMSALTARAVVSPVLSLDQEAIWYFDEAGKLYRNRLDGKNEQEFSLPNPRPATMVFWQPKGKDFIQRLPGTSGRGETFRLYQAEAKTFVDYPANFQSVAWLAGGKRIVYVWKSSDGTVSLKVSNADGSNYVTVAPLLGKYELEPSPVHNRVLLYQPTGEQSKTAVLLVDIDTKAVTELLDRGRNLEVKFSPDGTKLLFNRVNEQTRRPELWLHDFTQRSFTNLKIATSVGKTAWHSSSSKFYYALPEAVTSGDVRVAQKTKDAFYVYSLSAGSSARLSAEGQSAPVDGRELVVADADNALFFRNGEDNKLYTVKYSGETSGGSTEYEPYH